MTVDWKTVIWLMPEISLVVMATWIFLCGTVKKWQNRPVLSFVGIASFCVAALSLYKQISVDDWVYWTESFNWLKNPKVSPLDAGPVAIDFLANWCRWIAIVAGILLVLMGSRNVAKRLSAEYLGTVLLTVVGLMLIGNAGEMVMLFLGLELVSIPTYVLLFLGRHDRSSAESTAKYFFLSILSSAILLYGFSFLYGIRGTTSLTAAVGPTEAILGAEGLAFGEIALVLIVAGIAFKIAAVPFHFYAPDVYQGTTNANAGLLAVVPKIAGVVALLRIMPAMLPFVAEFAWQLTIALALLSMTLGNVCALWQNDVRRMMAYSSIAHAGYMLIGVAVALASASTGGVSATLFYLSVYMFASIATFAALTYLSSDERELSKVDDLAGLGRRQPLVAAVLGLAMFSLAGIPPLVGFWGKFSLFTSAVSVAIHSEDAQQAKWFVVLAIVGALNAAVAAAYYLRVIGTMYFRSATTDEPATPRPGMGAFGAMCACGVLLLVLGVMPTNMMRFADHAGHAVQRRIQTSQSSFDSRPKATAFDDN